MRSVDDEQSIRYKQTQGLVPYKVCIVKVCGFSFQFHSLIQLELCLDYYSIKHHPSSRLPVYTQYLGEDRWETQRWFDRLPPYLLEKSKRPKVIKALKQALIKYKAYSEANTNTLKPKLYEWKN